MAGLAYRRDRPEHGRHQNKQGLRGIYLFIRKNIDSGFIFDHLSRVAERRACAMPVLCLCCGCACAVAVTVPCYAVSVLCCAVLCLCCGCDCAVAVAVTVLCAMLCLYPVYRMLIFLAGGCNNPHPCMTHPMVYPIHAVLSRSGKLAPPFDPHERK